MSLTKDLGSPKKALKNLTVNSLYLKFKFLKSFSSCFLNIFQSLNSNIIIFIASLIANIQYLITFFSFIILSML